MQTKRAIILFSAISALLALEPTNAYRPGKVSAGGSSSAKSQPGYCTKPEDCKVAGYECVALQTTRAGTEDVKQCVPKKQDTDVCSGQYPGLCPSFASWTEPYKLISSVCTYKPAKKCAKDPSGPSVKGEVVCVPGALDQNGDPLQVIYGCVDIDISGAKLGFTDAEDAGKLAKKLGTAATVMDACLDPKASNATSSLLCGGHGTCLATKSASLEYECRCNIGYSGTFCSKKDSNKCALPGQCSAGECNLTTQVCECPAGTTGNQCADCDASTASACSGNGKCINKQCTCNAGFLGDHCDQKTKPKTSASASASNNNSTDSAGNAIGSSATSVSHNLKLTVAMAMVTALLTAL